MLFSCTKDELKLSVIAAYGYYSERSKVKNQRIERALEKFIETRNKAEKDKNNATTNS